MRSLYTLGKVSYDLPRSNEQPLLRRYMKRITRKAMRADERIHIRESLAQ
jgi:hypothetical protein